MYPPGALCYRNHHLGYTYIKGGLKLSALPPCSTADGPYRHPAMLLMPPVSHQRTHHRNRKPCAEVRRLDYVHACRHIPSSLFTGPRDAPVLPLSC